MAKIKLTTIGYRDSKFKLNREKNGKISQEDWNTLINFNGNCQNFFIKDVSGNYNSSVRHLIITEPDNNPWINFNLTGLTKKEREILVLAPNHSCDYYLLVVEKINGKPLNGAEIIREELIKKAIEKENTVEFKLEKLKFELPQRINHEIEFVRYEFISNNGIVKSVIEPREWNEVNDKTYDLSSPRVKKQYCQSWMRNCYYLMPDPQLADIVVERGGVFSIDSGFAEDIVSSEKIMIQYLDLESKILFKDEVYTDKLLKKRYPSLEGIA